MSHMHERMVFLPKIVFRNYVSFPAKAKEIIYTNRYIQNCKIISGISLYNEKNISGRYFLSLCEIYIYFIGLADRGIILESSLGDLCLLRQPLSTTAYAARGASRKRVVLR